MEKEEVLFLNQLVKALEESEKDLEKSFERKNNNRFNNSKRVMLKVQKEIAEIIK